MTEQQVPPALMMYADGDKLPLDGEQYANMVRALGWIGIAVVPISEDTREALLGRRKERLAELAAARERTLSEGAYVKRQEFIKGYLDQGRTKQLAQRTWSSMLRLAFFAKRAAEKRARGEPLAAGESAVPEGLEPDMIKFVRPGRPRMPNIVEDDEVAISMVSVQEVLDRQLLGKGYLGKQGVAGLTEVVPRLIEQKQDRAEPFAEPG